MIGQTILTPRHLYKKLQDGQIQKVALFLNNQRITIGEVVKLPPSVYGAECVALINDYRSDVDICKINPVRKDFDEKTYQRLMYHISHRSRCKIFTSKALYFDSAIQSVTLLPLSFNQDFAEFYASNKKNVSSTLRKYDLDIDHAYVQSAFMLSNGSIHMFNWVLNTYMSGRMPWLPIRNIALWQEKYPQYVGQLKKGSITAYTSYADIVSLIQETNQLRRAKRVNDVINSFNTTQKKILKQLDKTKLSKEDIESFSKFSRLSLTKRQNFIRKMSTVDDATVILQQMHYLTNITFKWNKQSLNDYLEHIEGLQTKKVLETDSLVLVEVKDFDTVKRLAKNTNWCISKNKRYWNDYVGERKNITQYMLFDFGKKEDDKYSIIGFTSKVDAGITHAHNFVNENLMSSLHTNQLKSYMLQNQSPSSVYDILKKHNIDIEVVTKVSAYPFKWDKDSFLNYVKTCIQPYNITILKDKDGLLAVSITDSNIIHMLGQSYFEEYGDEYRRCQHILFLNFNLPPTSPKAFCFAIIKNDHESCECYVDEVRSLKWKAYVQHFNQVLMDYGLPYNTIKRIDKPFNYFRDAFFSHNLDLSYVSDDTRKYILQFKQEYQGDLYNRINNSITHSWSFDYIDWIYNNGLTLSEVLDVTQLGYIILNAVSAFRRWDSIAPKKDRCKLPSETEIKEFFDETYTNDYQIGKVFNYLVIQKIMHHEANTGYLSQVFQSITGTNPQTASQIYHYIIEEAFDRISFSEESPILSWYIPLLFKYNKTSLIDALANMPTACQLVKSLVYNETINSSLATTLTSRL